MPNPSDETVDASRASDSGKHAADTARPSPPKRGRRIGWILLAFAVVLGTAGIYFATRGRTSTADTPRELKLVYLNVGSREQCGSPTDDRRAVVITMMSGDEKKEWVEYAANRFANLCPNIQVKLVIKSSTEAGNAILNGEIKPTVFSPADSLVARYLDYKWSQKFKSSLFNLNTSVSLVQSPLVWVTWDDRDEVLAAILQSGRSAEGMWMQASCALIPREPDLDAVAPEDMLPGQWIDWFGNLAPKKTVRRTVTSKRPFPPPEEIRQWGRVKFAHTSPTQSGSGLSTLFLMAYDYALPPNERREPAMGSEQAEDASLPVSPGSPLQGEALRNAFYRAFETETRKQAFQRWLQRCEAGVETFETSTRNLTQDILESGKGRHDIIATYEHMTFVLLDQLEHHTRDLSTLRLHIVYPSPTLWADHPAVILQAETLHPDELEAAEKWIAFLQSSEMQEKAIDYGFRPLRGELHNHNGESNPFLRFRRFGVEIDLERTEAPRLDGNAVSELIDIWSKATGRY